MNSFYSNFTDPFLNLAIEDKLLRDYSDSFLFIWRSSPSIVFGKFQNPWIEANVPFCLDHGVNIVRRQSGGGCVYHDKGNINFSFISSNSTMAIKPDFSALLNWLHSKKIKNIAPNDRHDLLVDETFKITGSAFKKTKNRQCHHYTFLVDTDLDFLRKCLKSPLSVLETKSLPSKPSKVKSLSELESISSDEAFKSLAKFHQAVEVSQFIQLSENENMTSRADSWNFGQSPLFTFVHPEMGEITIKKSLIINFSKHSDLEGSSLFDSEDSRLKRVYSYLMGSTS